MKTFIITVDEMSFSKILSEFNDSRKNPNTSKPVNLPPFHLRFSPLVCSCHGNRTV